jgi:acid phosphatase type 7
VGPLAAHFGDHPSIHDTVAAILTRMKREMSQTNLTNLTVAKIESFLTDREREILGAEHLSFTVNVPVKVSVIRSTNFAVEPFWLKERGFRRTSVMVILDEDAGFDVWEKEFDVGWIGLGVNSLRGGGNHYFVAVTPKKVGDKLEITDIYPGQATLGAMRLDEKCYTDSNEKISSLPPELENQTLVRTRRGWRDHGRLLNVLRYTEHPSSKRPDHIILTWSGDPRTSQSIQWRTSPKTKRGVVAYQKKSAYASFYPKALKKVKARTSSITDSNLLNDPVIHWHTVALTGLDPGTTYVYSVGDGTRDGWTELAEFSTAPHGTKPFSFMYMGDAQNGLDRWGSLVRNAFLRRPDAAFYIMAGDLVSRGAERDDWDALFHNAEGIYDRRQLVPVLGNHECQGGQPKLYLSFFNLPTNGPAAVAPERAYAFDYGNALFVVLDSNLKPELQTEWLEKQLADTRAKWKFVIYHHPMYSSAPKRDNKAVRESWGPIFDKYHVDLALQGHDHAYLRTFPMKGNRPAGGVKDGTVYIVSVSGTKFYKQDTRDYTEFAMTNIATYQVLDIQISGDRLVYRAYDIDGTLRDELVIEK